MSLNFLVASWGNPGNLNPILTAARRLRQRGHRVRILDVDAHCDEVRRAGFDCIAWRRPLPPQPPQADDGDPQWSEIKMLMEQIMYGAAIDYARDTMDALRKEPVDAVVVNDLLAGPAIAAEAAGLPCALLSPHVSVRPIDGIPFCFDGTAPDGTAEFDAADRAERTRFAELTNGYLPTLNRARAAFGLVPLRDVYEHYDRADRLLIGISAAFDFPTQRLPANLRYVGPLLDMPAWAEQWVAPWPANTDRPRVLVSLSTSFQNQAAVLRKIIAALGPLDMDVVVTTGPAMDSESFDAPANIAIVRGAPHDAVMRQVSLVVTHGGHGTVARTLAHGRPLLVIPMGRDQGANAARVVARGAGLSLTTEATEAMIAAAVQRLATEPQFREAAERLARHIAHDAASSTLVEELEALASEPRLRRSA